MKQDPNRRVYRREPQPAARQAACTPTRRRKKASALPLVLALALMVALVGTLFMLLAGSGHAKAKSNATRLLVLDDAWSASLLERSADADRTQFLQDTLTEAQSYGADGVLWTARTADGSFLFRPEKNAKDQVSQSLTQTDRLFPAPARLHRWAAKARSCPCGWRP